MSESIGTGLSESTGLYIALFVCIFLLIACITAGAIYLCVSKHKQKKKLVDEPIAHVALQDNEELPHEILLVLLSAAVATALGEQQASRFRVVAFRRIGR